MMYSSLRFHDGEAIHYSKYLSWLCSDERKRRIAFLTRIAMDLKIGKILAITGVFLSSCISHAPSRSYRNQYHKPPIWVAQSTITMENKEEEITWSITLDKEAVFTEDEIGVLLHTATVSSSEAEKLIKMPDVEIVEILKKRDSNVRNLIMLCEMAEQVAAEAKEKGFPGKEYETVAEMRGMTDLAVNEAVLLARLKGTRLKASFASIITKLHLYKNAKLQFDETQKQG